MHHKASVNSSSVPTPPGKRGAIAGVISSGGGAFAILSQLGGWAFASPRATSRHLTHLFSKVSWKDKAFVEQWLVRQGLDKLLDVFKGMFSQF